MTHLNIEEIYLLKTLNCSDRHTALHDLVLNQSLTEDKDLQHRYRTLGEKLRAMTDEEFGGIDLSVYEEEAYE